MALESTEEYERVRRRMETHRFALIEQYNAAKEYGRVRMATANVLLCGLVKTKRPLGLGKVQYSTGEYGNLACRFMG